MLPLHAGRFVVDTTVSMHDERSAASPLALTPGVASPRLRGILRHYWGYGERTTGPLRRRELPSAGVVFIINLGEPLQLTAPAAAPRVVPAGGGFVAGLHDTYTLTETAGSQEGIELRLSPLGAYRLLGQPMADLANRSVALDDACGTWAVALGERLRNASGWEERFALLDEALSARLGEGRSPEPSPEVVWIWRQLVASGGRAAIAPLREELGWSPKRLIARFREQVGMPPKQAARLLRFQAAVALLGTNAPRWSEVAQACGYADQAHLIHEFRRFAGDTPEGLVRRRLAGGGGFAAD
jgi:AraC-like DNA-binding protein